MQVTKCACGMEQQSREHVLFRCVAVDEERELLRQVLEQIGCERKDIHTQWIKARASLSTSLQMSDDARKEALRYLLGMTGPSSKG